MADTYGTPPDPDDVTLVIRFMEGFFWVLLAVTLVVGLTGAL